MFKWNTDKIIDDLKKIQGVSDITNDGQGGDVDSDNICISVQGADDSLWVCGFSIDDEITDPSNTLVEMVALEDGLDSRGGLNSDDINVANAYVLVRQYFIDEGADVVASLDRYF